MSLSARIAATFNRSGAARDSVVGAAAMPAASRGSKGTGAPSTRRAPVALVAALALFAGLAFASSASAATEYPAPPTVSDVSYSSAHIAAEMAPYGSPNGFAEYVFQVSTDGGSSWTDKAQGFAEGGPQIVEANLSGLIGGTAYSARVFTPPNLFLGLPGVASPAPDPSFTTLPADPPTIPGAVVASEVFSLSAKVAGQVVRPSKSDDVICHFDYISDATYQENVTDIGAEAGFEGATPIDCEQNPIKDADAGTEKEVFAHLTGLSPATAYHLRLLADNAAPGVVTKEGANFTTEPPVAIPVVTKVNDADDVSYRSATLSGEVERPPGADPALDITSCRFEYVTDQQFTNSEFTEAAAAGCDQTGGGPITSEGSTEATATLSLKSGVTYHYRLAVENAGGAASKDADDNFTTIPGGEPTATTDSVTDVGYTTARVTGMVTQGAISEVRAYYWEYAVAGTEEWNRQNYTVLPESLPIGAPPLSRTSTLTGLIPDTEYKFRFGFGVEPSGETIPSPAPYPTATTRHLEEPTASCDTASALTGTSAHFSCAVDTHAPAGPLDALGKAAYKTEWHFECTPACPSGNLSGTVQGEEGSKAISVDATRLDANTHYEFKLIAHNELYTVETPLQSFDTPLIKPTLKALPGGSDGQGGYVLQGTVNPNGSEVSDCLFAWGPNSGEEPEDYAFQVDCSPSAPGNGAKAVTVEAPLTGLTPDANYNFRIFATNEAGTAKTENLIFKPTPAPKEACANAQIRTENNSSTLPECRAYEVVTPSGKEGFGGFFEDFSGGDRVRYGSGAGNIAKSGQNLLKNVYVSARSATGWATVPDLNGSSGSFYDAPSDVKIDAGGPGQNVFSADLLSSVWHLAKAGPSTKRSYYLRGPDGVFTLIGPGVDPQEGKYSAVIGGASGDLSHLLITSYYGYGPTPWGPGVYEFVGTGSAEPRRVDVDNSGSPISTCGLGATTPFSSREGRVALIAVAGGCGGASPPASELWARVDGTTSYDVSASRCDRSAADPGGACNGPVGDGGCGNQIGVGGQNEEVGPGCRGLKFQGAASNGSRVFFTTKQQLLDNDADETNDLYSCDIPSDTPAPVDDANPCAALRQVSAGDPAGAGVESVGATSDNGAAVLFTATGVLADDEDALGEKALAGDHNLYVWHADTSHPDGQTAFLARLDSDDLRGGNGLAPPQSTPDGRYVVFTTASRLDLADTDDARDVYRYDTETDELTRLSTNVSGVAGNGPFDASVSEVTEHHPTTTVSDDGQKIVFTTAEALNVAVDGNGDPDIYLWTPDRVSLVTTGSSGYAIKESAGNVLVPKVAIDASGRDIYFESAQPLTPADGDDLPDVYDARIGGGFSFAEAIPCSGADGACQSHAPVPVPLPVPMTAQPAVDGGNVKPCPKNKVAKGKKCVKKPRKKHAAKKHHKKNGKSHSKRASHNRGASR